MIAIQTKNHPYTPYGQMAIRNMQDNNITLDTSTPDTTLVPINIDVNYKKITGYSLEYSKGFILTNNGLQVLQSGIYRFGGWAAIRHESNNATAGILFVIRRNEVIIGNTPSPVPALMPNVGDVGLITGEGLVTLQAYDIVETYIGSDKAGDVTVENCTITGTYLSPY